MITKESLLAAKDSVNETILRVKQLYSNAPSEKKIIFVVEGKDDVPFYATSAKPYMPENWEIKIVPAKNRRNAVETYKAIDWSIVSKQLVYFFIDRDLSDYTDEETPIDSNIYVTTKYAIENELCTVDTFIHALEYHCDLVDVNETDEAAISSFFELCWNSFVPIAKPIMAQILYWKINGIRANYANFKIQNTFEITDNGTVRKTEYQGNDTLLQDLFKQSNVPFEENDISHCTTVLESKHFPEEYIRGKYILAFFSKSFTYFVHNSIRLLPSQKKAKDTLSLGYENIITRLCGIMQPPQSLIIFYKKIFTNIA